MEHVELYQENMRVSRDLEFFLGGSEVGGFTSQHIQVDYENISEAGINCRLLDKTCIWRISMTLVDILSNENKAIAIV